MTGDKDFKTEEDSKKRNRLLGLAYGSYLPFVFLTQTFLSPLEYAVKFAIVSAVAILPDFLGGAPGKGFLSPSFNEKALFKDAVPAPRDIAEDVEELRLKAGLPDKIGCYISGKADRYGAVVHQGAVYVGPQFARLMERAELKTILAHEIAHIKTEDPTEDVLFKPAKLNAVADVLMSATTLVAGAEAAGLKGIAAPLMGLLLSCIFYEFQDALDKANRRVHEYRADRNALKLTGDFRNMARAFVKMSPHFCFEASWTAQIFSKHPRGVERLRAMERESNGGTPTHFCDALLRLADAFGAANVVAASDRETLADMAWELTDGGTKPAPRFDMAV